MSGEAREEAARALARLLVRRLRERGGPADAPMTVAELRRQLLPYPRCREEAGLASKAEYDLAVLDLLASPRALEVEDPELAEAVDEERGAAEPGLGFLEGFAAATLRPGPALAGVSKAASEPTSAEPASPEPASPAERELRREPEPGPSTDPAAGSDPPATSDPAPASGAAPEPDPPAASPGCPSCGADLPDRDGLRFCPWCGVDLTTPRCKDCGEELEPDWRYCPGCGAPAPSDG